MNRSVRTFSVAMAVGAAVAVAPVTPAMAGSCRPTPYVCGVVTNSSAYHVVIGEWSDTERMVNTFELMPGEHSQKYLPDTDAFMLQCPGVALWAGGTKNHPAWRAIRISNTNTVDVRYQAC